MLISGLHMCSSLTQENVSTQDVSLDGINIGLGDVQLTDSKYDEASVGLKG